MEASEIQARFHTLKRDFVAIIRAIIVNYDSSIASKKGFYMQ